MYAYFIVTITNGPNNTTACSGSFVNISCGFTGAPASIAIPIWRITRRSDDGSVVSVTVAGSDIDDGAPVNGLQWIPDLTTGGNDAPHGVLRVGPVDETFHLSTYQCVFLVSNNPDINSTIGTLTVAGECALYYSVHTHPDQIMTKL